MMEWQVILVLLLVGSIAGFMAGLLGIGGGMIVVPIVLWALRWQSVDTMHAQHLAIGTSFAVMALTTFSSMMAQHRKKAIRWRVVISMAPGMVLGVLLGAYLAKYIPTQQLQLIFIVSAYLLSVQALLDIKPKPTRQLPKPTRLGMAGSVFGLFSSWIGIGGGSLSVPFMLYCNVPIREAVGTSAALSWPVAVSGAVGYLLSGWSVQGLPEYTFGFWYIPVAVVMAIATVTFAPIGVKAAHTLPPVKLKFVFGLLLFCVATQMLWKWIAA